MIQHILLQRQYDYINKKTLYKKVYLENFRYTNVSASWPDRGRGKSIDFTISRHPKEFLQISFPKPENYSNKSQTKKNATKYSQNKKTTPTQKFSPLQEEKISFIKKATFRFSRGLLILNKSLHL